jgi:methionyl-tRNA formyltransferase
MRIAFVTNKTAIVNMPVFERLVYGDNIDLAHTFFYDTVSESRTSPLNVITQFGFRRVVKKAFEAVRSSVRARLGKLLRLTSIQAKSPYELAVIRGLPHSTISDVNQPETIEFLRELNPDVVLVCVCKDILRQDVLSLPNTTFVNVHPSLLPRYRGPAPTFWMLYHGERETGVTFHLMTTKIDEGQILAQLSLPIDRRKSEVQIETEVFKLAATVVKDVLQNLDSGIAQSSSHRDGRESSYYSYPTQAQRRELKQSLTKP